jgi:undecaprenyl diphosphate synthase
MANKGISPLPTHVAIIMDGNGRWAEERGLPRIAGHYAGVESGISAALCFADYGIKFLTLYAFSTENWSRPPDEVAGLMQLFDEALTKKVRVCLENGIKLRHIGRLDGLSEQLQQKIQRAVEVTKDNQRMTLSIALNYGGRAELLDAVRRIMEAGIPPQGLDENLFNSYLYTAGLPDPDLIIRTGGETRLSNFLIWQAAYSEYYSIPTLWPDFDREEIEKALLSYSQRERRFGGLEIRGR